MFFFSPSLLFFISFFYFLPSTFIIVIVFIYCPFFYEFSYQLFNLFIENTSLPATQEQTYITDHYTIEEYLLFYIFKINSLYFVRVIARIFSVIH